MTKKKKKKIIIVTNRGASEAHGKPNKLYDYMENTEESILEEMAKQGEEVLPEREKEPDTQE